MSTNTALDDIKARAEVNKHLGKTASQDEAKDTLKLIAALEAVEALLAEKYKLWAAVCSETCVKDHHGIDHEAIADNIATNIRAAIQEALS